MKQTEKTETKKNLTDAELQQATGGKSNTPGTDCRTIDSALSCLDNYSNGCTWSSKEGYCYNFNEKGK